jgi:transcriptional regulator with XRE-family HTH domain
MKREPRRSTRLEWQDQYTRFRSRLIEAREQSGLSQRDAARLLGRTQSFVAKSETGERRVDVVELALFATVYAKPLSFFWPDEQSPE